MLYHQVTPDPATDQIVFVHIRKTAGTALAASLMQGLGAHAPMRTPWGSAERSETGVLALHGPLRRAAINLAEDLGILGRRLAGRPVHLMEDQPFYGAHMILGQAPPSPRPRHWITILRDPAERFLSDHAFMRGKRDRARSDCLDHRLYDLELAEFVAAIEARPEVYQHDYQCRQLADGRPDLEAARAAVDTQLWLAAALPQIDRFVTRIGEKLGIDFPPLGHVRRTRGRPGIDSLDPALAARIRALNPGDAALVEHTARAFEGL
ncbi:hypothetical protein [uncultured Albimonas sp.]|uniref:hypothetical protein n=1 Tax=uncultured Albimonas sp. TaxID=1331701 RepID=UPI0030EB4FE4